MGLARNAGLKKSSAQPTPPLKSDFYNKIGPKQTS
jgi:hypothetical protein